MPKPLVSVMLATYNRAAILKKTVDTILCQEGDFELVLIDNGSEDDTQSVIMSAMGRDKRVKAIKNPFNRGAAPVYNQAVRQAQGKYTILAGDDDFWTPNRFALLMENLDESLPWPVVYTDWVLLDEEGQALPYNTTQELYPETNEDLDDFSVFAQQPDFRLAFALYPTKLFEEFSPFVSYDRHIGSCADAAFTYWIALHGNMKRLEEVTVEKYEVAKKAYQGTHRTAEKPELLKWLKHLWLVTETVHALADRWPVAPARKQIYKEGVDHFLVGYLQRSLTWIPQELRPAFFQELVTFGNERGYQERLSWLIVQMSF